MILGIVLVVFWLLVISLGLVLLIVFGHRQLNRWLNSPDDPVLPPPNQLGAECIVLKFADQFVETFPKSEIPEWRRHRYTEVSKGKLALTDQLAEMMLFASLAELWYRGFISFRIVPKDPDFFDPQSLDKETWVKMGGTLPLTPLGRSFTVGFKLATRPVWLLREKRDEAVLEDMVEFALREMRRHLGWRKAKRNNAENLIRYVSEFVEGRPTPSDAVESVKNAIAAFQSQNTELAETVKATISYTLSTLRRLEPDRDELGL